MVGPYLEEAEAERFLRRPVLGSVRDDDRNTTVRVARLEGVGRKLGHAVHGAHTLAEAARDGRPGDVREHVGNHRRALGLRAENARVNKHLASQSVCIC